MRGDLPVADTGATPRFGPGEGVYARDAKTAVFFAAGVLRAERDGPPSAVPAQLASLRRHVEAAVAEAAMEKDEEDEAAAPDARRWKYQVRLTALIPPRAARAPRRRKPPA
jgi:hypothetical protein